MKALFKWKNGYREYKDVPAYPPPVMKVFFSKQVPPDYCEGRYSHSDTEGNVIQKEISFIRVNLGDSSFEYQEVPK